MVSYEPDNALFGHNLSAVS